MPAPMLPPVRRSPPGDDADTILPQACSLDSVAVKADRPRREDEDYRRRLLVAVEYQSALCRRLASSPQPHV